MIVPEAIAVAAPRFDMPRLGAPCFQGLGQTSDVDRFMETLPFMAGAGALLIGQNFVPATWPRPVRTLAIIAGVGLVGFSAYKLFFESPEKPEAKLQTSPPDVWTPPVAGVSKTSETDKKISPVVIKFDYVPEKYNPLWAFSPAIILYAAVRSLFNPQAIRSEGPKVKITIENNLSRNITFLIKAKKWLLAPPEKSLKSSEDVVIDKGKGVLEKTWPDQTVTVKSKEALMRLFDPETPKDTELRLVEFEIYEATSKSLLYTYYTLIPKAQLIMGE